MPEPVRPTFPGRHRSFWKNPFLPATVIFCLFCLASFPSADAKRSQPKPTPSPATRAASPTAASPTPLPFPLPTLSGVIPTKLPAHNTSLSPEQSRPFFDSFSWQSFVALNWPAVPGKRGEALKPTDPGFFRSAPNGTPVVWGTYKETFDLFGQRDQRPTEWESFTDEIAQCTNQPAGVKTLVMLSKGDSILDETNQAFSFPLIDQNKNYAHYEIRYNKAFYNFVRGSNTDPKSWLYQIANLAPREPVSMPAGPFVPDGVGALMLKAAWREMTPQDDPTRYYIVPALVYDPLSKTCVQTKVGLVGLHIAQKLKDFPEWIWSSFEQVDNVRRGPGAKPSTPISFNNGTDNPQTTGGYADRPAQKAPTAVPKAERTPVQVTRFNPIPDTPAGASTVVINNAWQAALKGTVWQNYELVITQWPSNPTVFKTMENGGVYPQDSGAAFPANGATNTAMETYFQSPADAAGKFGNSCMACHYGAGQSDFSWGLNRRAH
ncbi:MAG: hypothetical protein QOK24_2778 [Verrucomicrobiota bacterium]